MNKTIKTATLGIVEELRNMKVGEVVHFPMDRYNYNTIRATPATLCTERSKGKKWRTKANYEGKYVAVIRIA